MDSDRPAYWLSRPPDEAAAFLARTSVASRRVGGFVKHAQGSWQDTLNQIGGSAPFQHALIGAGVGGLGGLGVGMMNPRKRNPWSSALTGAALGTGAGLAYSGLHHAFTDPGSGAGPPANAAKDQQAVQTVRNMNPIELAAGKLYRWGRESQGLENSADTAEVDRIGPGALAVQAARSTPLAGAFITNPVRTLGAAGAAGLADRAVRSGINTFNQNRQTAKAFDLGMAHLPHSYVDPAIQGHLNDLRQNVLDTAAPSRHRIANVWGIRELVRAAREAHVGRDIAAGQIGGGLSARPISDVLATGRSKLPDPIERKGFGKAIRGWMPSVAAQIGAQLLNQSLPIWSGHVQDQGDMRYRHPFPGLLSGFNPFVKW